jgi:hypothetical protein
MFVANSVGPTREPARSGDDPFQAAAFLLLLLTLTGCGPTYKTFFVERRAMPYWQTLARPHPFPLARRLTWKYQYTFGKNYALFLADGQPIWNEAQMKGVQLYAAQPTTSGGTKLSEVYAQRAREATATGRTQQAQTYAARSEIALQSEIATERTATAIALIGAGAALGEALGRMVADDVATEAANGTILYFTQGPRTVISDAAPEGSVLELYFLLHGNEDAKRARTYQRRFDVVATLRDGAGRIWRSGAGYTEWMLTTPQPTVPPDMDRDLLLVNANGYVPFREAAHVNYTPEITEIFRMASTRGHAEFALVGEAAIQGLYEQFAAAAAPAAAPSPSDPGGPSSPVPAEPR